MKSKTLLNTAMILAAGFGTRLKPLTESIPKALVEYNGKPMVYHVIKKLESFGIKKIVLNTHHLAGKINDYFANNSFDAEIILVHEEMILGTGGAIKNAKNLLNSPGNFLVYNVDVDSGIDIQLMFEHHKMSSAIATLAVKNRITSRYLLTNEENILIGRTENGKEIFYREPEGYYLKTAFCGISILNDEIFSYLPENKYFEIIPEFMKLVNKRKLIRVFDIGDTYWSDLGKQVIEK